MLQFGIILTPENWSDIHAIIAEDLPLLFVRIYFKSAAINKGDVTVAKIFSFIDFRRCFWDIEHPTTTGDALIANAAYDAYAAPEPLSAGLSLLGFVAVLTALKLRRKHVGI